MEKTRSIRISEGTYQLLMTKARERFIRFNPDYSENITMDFLIRRCINGYLMRNEPFKGFDDGR